MIAEVRTEHLHTLPLVLEDKAINMFDLSDFTHRMSERLEKVRRLNSKKNDEQQTAYNDKEYIRS
ncbi:MAG: hypothetical protein E7019_02855 [Alphaproteobacteria bacterium]|nr:hypothetical protein [Alphaproteobacteria bacterium]